MLLNHESNEAGTAPSLAVVSSNDDDLVQKEFSGTILALTVDSLKPSSSVSAAGSGRKTHQDEAQIIEFDCNAFYHKTFRANTDSVLIHDDMSTVEMHQKHIIDEYQQTPETDIAGDFKQDQTSNNNSFKVLRTCRSRLGDDSVLLFGIFVAVIIIAVVSGLSWATISSSSPENDQPIGNPMTRGINKPFETTEELRRAVSRWLHGEDGEHTALAATYGYPLGRWDVSMITDFSHLFDACEVEPCASFAYTFNEDLSLWNVSSAKNMSYMFANAGAFDCDLSMWDVSSVTDMSGMFSRASSFNGDLSLWDVSSVTNMSWMFAWASSFNGDLSMWDVGQVKSMRGLFASAPLFEGTGLSNWNVSNVIDISSMFSGTYAFDQDLTNWDVSRVTDMSNTFAVSISFSGDGLPNWNVTSVVDMNSIFRYAYALNQDLSSWDVSSVLNMRGAFAYAYSFGTNLCEWGTRLPADSITAQAFLKSDCPDSGDPDLSQTTPGPFCHRCA